MECRQCEMLQDDYPIKVVDKPSLNFMSNEEYHFEDGYHCNYNGITSNKLSDLQKGNCRCKQ